MKKWISILLTVCLLFSTFAMSASAFTYEEYMAKWNEIKSKWTALGEEQGLSEGDIQLSAQIEMNEWEESENAKKPKITPLLQETMDESAEDAVLSVYVYFKTIPYETAEDVAQSIRELAEKAYDEGAAVSSNAVREVVVNAGLERFADGVVTLVDEWYQEEERSKSEMITLYTAVVSYLSQDVREVLARDLMAELGFGEEQIQTIYPKAHFMILKLTLSDIAAAAQNEKVTKLDWSSGDVFDFATYYHPETFGNPPEPGTMSLLLCYYSCGCIFWNDLDCEHCVVTNVDEHKSFDAFQWNDDVDYMVDYENDMDKVPGCFNSKITNIFGSGCVLFLNGVPNLGDYLMFFERRVKEVYIPNTVKKIGDHTFSQFADVSIYCYSGSYAEEYAKTHNIECHLLDTGEVIPAAMSGDANGDGVRNLKDVLALRKALADGTESELPAGADCNVDGEVNMKDVLMLRQHLAGLFV